MEKWQDIVGYEGLYKVSSLGRIERQEYKQILPNGAIGIIKRHYVKAHIGTNGYPYVGLCKGNKVRNYSVHRLVAQAFVPNPNGHKEINHIDENKLNPCVDNLEWCDRKYNDSYGTGRERQAIAESIPVDRYTMDGQYVDTWVSEKQYLKEHGITGQSMILKVCRRIRPYYSAYGYRWKFVGDERPFEPIPIGGYPVQQFTKDGAFIKEYPNAFLASKETGICYTSIRKCVVGRQETAGSYIWKNKQG